MVQGCQPEGENSVYAVMSKLGQAVGVRVNEVDYERSGDEMGWRCS